MSFWDMMLGSSEPYPVYDPFLYWRNAQRDMTVEERQELERQAERQRQMIAPYKPASLALDYPIRKDFLAQVIVPRDLTVEEAQRLCEFVKTLASPDSGTGPLV